MTPTTETALVTATTKFNRLMKYFRENLSEKHWKQISVLPLSKEFGFHPELFPYMVKKEFLEKREAQNKTRGRQLEYKLTPLFNEQITADRLEKLNTRANTERNADYRQRKIKQERTGTQLVQPRKLKKQELPVDLQPVTESTPVAPSVGHTPFVKLAEAKNFEAFWKVDGIEYGVKLDVFMPEGSDWKDVLSRAGKFWE